ncbi:hypothetical protein AVEN_196799-1 [Araneus ventricosus]|uniref:Uncharacterized protein n=1 Tax=Araneus ventricosus TaxID=182803 RepID=A0A4Y2QQI3_ARAVE|nr:hypothetical protein AVEN_196799-1 [Araneus ventricosus]
MIPVCGPGAAIYTNDPPCLWTPAHLHLNDPPQFGTKRSISLIPPLVCGPRCCHFTNDNITLRCRDPVLPFTPMILTCRTRCAIYTNDPPSL